MLKKIGTFFYHFLLCLKFFWHKNQKWQKYSNLKIRLDQKNIIWAGVIQDFQFYMSKIFGNYVSFCQIIVKKCFSDT